MSASQRTVIRTHLSYFAHQGFTDAFSCKTEPNSLSQEVNNGTESPMNQLEIFDSTSELRHHVQILQVDAPSLP